MTAPVLTPVKVVSDRAYSRFDHFFYPQGRTITFAYVPDAVAQLGAGLAGGDRLGLQRWAVQVGGDFSERPALYSFYGGYRNAMLAPWALTLEAADLHSYLPVDTDPERPGFEDHVERRTRLLVTSVGRVIRGTTALSLLGIYFEDDHEDEPPRRRLGGPGLSVGHDNIEATRYGGTRRRLGLHLAGAYYPDVWSTLNTDVIDTRAELGLTLPVPATRRHALSLTARHRRVAPRDPAPGFIPLEVGGTGAFVLYERRDPEDDPPDVDDIFHPDRLRFVETLRGFEDWSLPARAAALGELSWSYPIPIDAGWATTLYFLPASMLRDLELELFGSGALLTPPLGGGLTHHLAIGGSLGASLLLLRVPILLQYQLARRLTDDEAISHQVGVALSL